MAVKKSLKRIFIVFNALFAAIGIVIFVKDVKLRTQAEGNQATAGQTIGGLVAVISILGVFGAYEEKKWALKLFSVLLGLGMAVCLVAPLSVVIVLPRSWHEGFPKILDAIVGFFFGLALVALIGITMAVSMVYQIKDGEQGPVVMAVPTFDYSQPPPAYSDIFK